jgi:hypothetical protein
MKTKPASKRQKRVPIVIRGCLFHVLESEAAALRKTEAEMTVTDWNRNRVD